MASCARVIRKRQDKKPVRQQPLQGYLDHLVTSSSNTRPYKRKAITPVERNETKNYRPYEGHGELTLRQENEKRETNVFNKNKTVTNIVNRTTVYCESQSRSWCIVLDTIFCDKDCQ
jgi:hypothetical protein